LQSLLFRVFLFFTLCYDCVWGCRHSLVILSGLLSLGITALLLATAGVRPALVAARAVTTERRVERKVDVLLRVETHLMGVENTTTTRGGGLGERQRHSLSNSTQDVSRETALTHRIGAEHTRAQSALGAANHIAHAVSSAIRTQYIALRTPCTLNREKGIQNTAAAIYHRPTNEPKRH
jgi:hypothetical protein